MREESNIISTKNYGKSSRTFSQIIQVLKKLPAGKRRILVYDIEDDYERKLVFTKEKKEDER